MRILLIAGGWSTEREISLRGARVMAEALRRMEYQVTLFDLIHFDDLICEAKRHDLALINLHGDPGEDGLVQAMLDYAEIPHQGTGPSGSLLSLHKAATKQILVQKGIATPRWEFLPLPPKEGWTPRLPYPLFVKSETGGSSIHLSHVEDRASLDRAMEEIFSAGCGVLIEEAIEGHEVTCGVLDNEALEPLLIEPSHGGYFDYSSKYEEDGAKESYPIPFSPSVRDSVMQQSLIVHRTLGLEGVSRSDFMIDREEKILFLEVNTIPGMTPTSLVPKEAAAKGLSFSELMQKFVEMALKKKRD